MHGEAAGTGNGASATAPVPATTEVSVVRACRSVSVSACRRTSVVPYVREEAQVRVIRGADEQSAVEQDVVLLTARLRDHHAGLAGGEVGAAGAGCLGLDAERVGGTLLPRGDRRPCI